MPDPLIAVRAIHFAASALTAGALLFEVAIACPAFGGRNRARAYFITLERGIFTGVGLMLASGLAWDILLAIDLGDGILAGDTFLTLMTQTRFGCTSLVRAALAILVTVMLRRRPVVALVSAILMVMALALIGHAGAHAGAAGWLQLLSDMAHLAAASIWLGSLPALALLLSRSDIPASMRAAATRRFSVFGIGSVPALLVTGAVNTWFLIDRVTALPETDYGRLLLLKIGLFAAMIVLAAINRWHWTPQMPERRAIGMVRRHSIVETALGLGIIAIVGALGTLPPPLHRHIHINDAGTAAAFVHIHDVTAMADVTVVPGRAGPSEIWLRLMREDFSPLPAEAVTVTLTQAGRPPVTAEARSGAVGLWRASELTLPTPGVWTVLVQIQTHGTRLSLDAPLVIEP